VIGFTIANARVVRIDALLDPERLARLDVTVPPPADDQA